MGKNAFQAVTVFLAFIGLLISSAYFLLSATAWGKLVSLGSLALALLPLCLYSGWSGRSWRAIWMALSAALALTVAGIILWVIINAPTGEARPGAPISQHFTGSQTFPRYALTNVVPETEQINMGFLVMPFLDQYFTIRQSIRDSVFTLNIYREMEADPDFHQMGSALGWSYAELFNQPYNVGHYYLYVPQKRPVGALPALIYLHGSLGNFKAYTYVLSRLAEQRGMVIISPSFGFGNWNQPGGKEAIFQALADAGRYVQIDPGKVYLAGLSNGGLGVSLASASAPDQFRGLIFISAVYLSSIVDSPAYQQSWAGRPMLVVAGVADERIPISYQDGQVARFKAAGVQVTYVPYAGEDHFLFFSQRESILKDIAEWMGRY